MWHWAVLGLLFVPSVVPLRVEGDSADDVLFQLWARERGIACESRTASGSGHTLMWFPQCMRVSSLPHATGDAACSQQVLMRVLFDMRVLRCVLGSRVCMCGVGLQRLLHTAHDC